MAKEMAKVQILIEVPYSAGVRDDANITMAHVNYSVCDSVDSGLQRSRGLSTTESVPEILSTDELGAIGIEGTILYKIAAVETVVKTKEGI